MEADNMFLVATQINKEEDLFLFIGTNIGTSSYIGVDLATTQKLDADISR